MLLCALAGLALASPAAHAETTHPFLTSLNGSDTPSGSFRVAGRVGLDQGSGDVYVVDISSVFAGTGAVEVFDSSGVFQREITGEGTPAGSFAFSRIGSSGVAIDASGGPADGDVYVADTRNDVVDVFDSTGVYERQLSGIVAPTGVAVDADGHVWVAESGSGEDTNGMVHEFDETGALVQSWPNGYFQTDAIALDSTGRVYLLNGAGDVTRWTATGGDETLITDSGTGLAIDPGDDHLYVDKRNSVSEFDETGAFVIEFGAGRVSNSFGVAVHGASGRVFVSNSIPPVQVNVFGPLATIPDVSLGSASAITATSATLSGTINPVGIAATYQFEWGIDSDYGNVAPATAADAGAGTDEVPATANLSGLTPGTTYHYRLRGTNAGGSNFSQDGTFTTLSPPVIVSTAGKGGLGSATLTAQVNPQGADTAYHFEYGLDDGYGSSTPETPLGGGFDDLTATATVSGLESGTTYHYRVIATSAAAESAGPDQTFTTLSAPAQPPAGGGGSGSAVAPPPSPPKTPLQVAPITRKQLANWARTGRVTLRVTVGGAGTVTARARAKLPGHWTPSTVARASKTATGPGELTLTLRLARSASRALARVRLPVTIVVDGASSNVARTLRVTLRRPRA